MDEMTAGNQTQSPEQQATGAGQATIPVTGQEQAQQPQAEQPKLKVKFNHEERELTYDEAIQYAQKGLNYDRIYPEYEKLRNDPARAFVETEAARYGMTVPQYLQAVERAREEEALNELIQRNIPPEYAQEMLENRKFREQYQAEREAIQKERAKERDYQNFIEWYAKTYGKEPNPEEIPPEVWLAVERGMPLKFAYMEHIYPTLHERISQVEQGQQTQQANQKNANSSTGSVKSIGNPQTFFTKEQVEKMSIDEIQKNRKAIDDSMKHW